MTDLGWILIAVYLMGAFIAYLLWMNMALEGYSVIWWPITLVKALARSLWDAIRY